MAVYMDVIGNPVQTHSGGMLLPGGIPFVPEAFPIEEQPLIIAVRVHPDSTRFRNNHFLFSIII